MDNAPKTSPTNATKAWMTITALWTAIFIAWLIVGGFRWEGFPCFVWNVTLPVRATALILILIALVCYCRELYRVILDPHRFTTTTILLAITSWTLRASPFESFLYRASVSISNSSTSERT